ncbi:MAG TPA: hypothetical protein VNI77_02980 [Nitrososphaera sp.]|nr:hypothetical protein [Nitrososphaera sp.]
MEELYGIILSAAAAEQQLLPVALAALAITSTWLGISDWRSRTVGHGVIRVCYAVTITINMLIAAAAMVSSPANNMADAMSKLIAKAAPTAIIIALLSGAVIAFWKLDLLASGDAYAIPALLTMLLLVATPAVVAIYFIAAMAGMAATFVAKNTLNNIRYRDRLYGPPWHRLYLMLFCYYGSSSDIRYAFAYKRKQQQGKKNDSSDNDYDGDGNGNGNGNGNGACGCGCCGNNNDISEIRRDYDGEPFYEGKERMWLVPGLPLLSGFAPAAALVVIASATMV